MTEPSGDPEHIRQLYRELYFDEYAPRILTDSQKDFIAEKNADGNWCIFYSEELIAIIDQLHELQNLYEEMERDLP